MHNAVHCTDLPEDGLLEVSHLWPHSLLFQSWTGAVWAERLVAFTNNSTSHATWNRDADLMTVHCRLNQTHCMHNVSGKEEQEKAGLSGGRAVCFSGTNFDPFSIIVSHKLQIWAASLTNGSLLIIRLLGSSASTFLERPYTRGHAHLYSEQSLTVNHSCRHEHSRTHFGPSEACFGKVSCYERK